MSADLIAELARLHHRATDLRAREAQLADAGENDPASDTWKTAAIVAASAECEFEAALVEAWPALDRLLREADQWRAREAALTHARAQAGEPVAAGAWTREDLAAGLAELDGIDLVPPLKSVVDLEYLNRADDLLTFLSVASAANEPLGAIHPAPAQEPVEVPAGMTADQAWQDLCEKDDRTSIDYPGFALIRQDELAGYMAAAPVSPPAESREVGLRGPLQKLVDAADAMAWSTNSSSADAAIEEARQALASTPAPPPGSEPKGCPTPGACSCPQPGGAVKVKALEFPPRCPRGQRVHSRPQALIRYTIAHHGGDVGSTVYQWASEGGNWSEPHHTYEAAIGCAQADYEQRILSALSPSPSGWDAGAKDWREQAAELVEKLADEGCCASWIADQIRAFPLSTPPAGEG